MKSEALTDLYAILTAGGRNNGEKSRALPESAYRDPAESVQFPAEKERARKLKEAKKLKKPKYRMKGRR
jgi:hypothetical protein